MVIDPSISKKGETIFFAFFLLLNIRRSSRLLGYLDEVDIEFVAQEQSYHFVHLIFYIKRFWKFKI